MTVRVLRPRPRFVAVPAPSSAPSPSPSRPSSGGSSRSFSVSSWDVWPIGVEWDQFRSLHIARCQRCAESLASPLAGEVDDWADAHRCDPEMAALLALVDIRRTSRRAA